MPDERWRPQRRIELIAGTPPGGGQDRAARALAAALGPLLGVPVEVVNIPGRGGSAGWESLAATPGNPHRLSISSPTLVTNVLTGASRIDHHDLTAVALLCTEYILFAVPTASAFGAADEVVMRLGTAAPPVTALATARGNVNHLALARVARHTGTAASSLPIRVFDSAREAIADVLSGQADVAAVSAASAVSETAAGLLRGLAVTAPVRLLAPFAGVPTWEELSIACTMGTWRGLVASPGIEDPARRFWDETVTSAVASPAWQSALQRHHWTGAHLGPEATDEFHRGEQQALGALLRELGLIGG